MRELATCRLFGKTDDPKQWELVKQLNDLAHELDDTRITVGASNQSADHPGNVVRLSPYRSSERKESSGTI